MEVNLFYKESQFVYFPLVSVANRPDLVAYGAVTLASGDVKVSIDGGAWLTYVVDASTITDLGRGWFKMLINYQETIPSTAKTCSAQAALNTIICAGGDFVALGFRVGMTVTTAGFTKPANNVTGARITSVSTTELTLNTLDAAIEDETAAAITVVGNTMLSDCTKLVVSVIDQTPTKVFDDQSIICSTSVLLSKFPDSTVYHNGASLYSGTTYPLGTAIYPVNNLQDAAVIAGANNLQRIKTKYSTDETISVINQVGSLCIEAGVRNAEANLTLTASQSGSHFIAQTLDMGAAAILEECVIQDCYIHTADSSFDLCHFYDCRFNETGINLNLDTRADFFNCFFNKVPIGTYGTRIQDVTATADGGFLFNNCRGYLRIEALKGYVEIKDFFGTIDIGVLTAGSSIRIFGGMGEIIQDPGCLATVVIEGFYPTSGRDDNNKEVTDWTVAGNPEKYTIGTGVNQKLITAVYGTHGGIEKVESETMGEVPA